MYYGPVRRRSNRSRSFARQCLLGRAETTDKSANDGWPVCGRCFVHQCVRWFKRRGHSDEAHGWANCKLLWPTGGAINFVFFIAFQHVTLVFCGVLSVFFSHSHSRLWLAWPVSAKVFWNASFRQNEKGPFLKESFLSSRGCNGYFFFLKAHFCTAKVIRFLKQTKWFF